MNIDYKIYNIYFMYIKYKKELKSSIYISIAVYGYSYIIVTSVIVGIRQDIP